MQLGGAVQHRVEALIFHPLHIDPAHKEARNPGEDDGYIVPGAHPGHFNRLVEAGGVKAAQAGTNLVRVQGNTHLLRQLTGQWLQQIFADAIEGYAHHIKARPFEQRTLPRCPRAQGEREWALSERPRLDKQASLNISEP